MNTICRELELSDYHKAFLQCLTHLTSTKLLTYDEFQSIYNNYPGKVYVIEIDNKIVATASLVIEHNIFETIAHIENVVTLPSHRGLGYAKLLLNKIIDQPYKMDLYCNPENADFYKKLGFSVSGKVMTKYKI